MKKKCILFVMGIAFLGTTTVEALQIDPPVITESGNEQRKSPAKAIIISYDNLMQMVYVTFNKSYSNVEMMLVKDGMIVGNGAIGDAEAGMTEVLSLSGFGAGCYEVYIAVDGAVSATAQITVK